MNSPGVNCPEMNCLFAFQDMHTSSARKLAQKFLKHPATEPNDAGCIKAPKSEQLGFRRLKILFGFNQFGYRRLTEIQTSLN